MDRKTVCLALIVVGIIVAIAPIVATVAGIGYHGFGPLKIVVLIVGVAIAAAGWLAMRATQTGQTVSNP